MHCGKLMREDHATEESIEAKAKATVENQAFTALTGDEGLLPAGAVPLPKTATEAGAKALMKALDEGAKVTTLGSLGS